MASRRIDWGLTAAFSAGISGMIFVIAICVAWVTHVMWWIGKLAGDGGATVGQVFLAIIGTLVPPIGVIHGFMIWFGRGF